PIPSLCNRRLVRRFFLRVAGASIFGRRWRGVEISPEIFWRIPGKKKAAPSGITPARPNPGGSVPARPALRGDTWKAMAVEASAHRSSLTMKPILNENHLHLKGAADKFRSTSKRSRVCHDGFHLFDQDIAAGSGHT